MIQKIKSIRSIWFGRILRYAPLLFWLGVIYYASTNQFSNDNTSKVVHPFLNWLFFSPSEETIDLLHIIIRKCAHFIEYAVLAFFLYRALHGSNKSWLNNYWFAWSLTILIFYAFFDEYHQSFMSTRLSSIYDSLIDISGGLTVLCFFKWFKRHRQETPEERLLQQN